MLPSPRLLAAARILANVTQTELALRAGVSVSALRRLEVGDTDARLNTVLALTEALRACGIEFLLEPSAKTEGIRHTKPPRTTDSPVEPEDSRVQRKRVGAARSRRNTTPP
ncbi:helix-turn-helix domain-containing protein [Pseudoroseomonas wenyumeiae]|uniref:Helix-turn-helix domain-containing protein n=1 Tax=Teichococcus wenyumeiae TaxID=2478470 RepID=A0A3A9JM81_9PROT|nr:helix-turn-helix domain-containing protein [Pseudoroseomonas wenyumeiae]RMI26157.1 helix-turn-helix domain-containing protein [Pseudoroseomonas wenyumeiae]